MSSVKRLCRRRRFRSTLPARGMRLAMMISLLGFIGALGGCAGRKRANGGTASAPPALGAHTLLTHDQGKGTSPATTVPVATQPAGSLLLAIGMGRTPNFVVPTDSYGNAWSSVGGRHRYANGPFYTAVWAAARARGGAGHTLSAPKPSDPLDELDLALVEITNATRIVDDRYAYPKGGSPMTAGSVTTDGPATLIAIWSGDGSELVHTAIPGDGFQVIDAYLKLGATSGIQAAIATRQVSAAGKYSMTWTATPVQGAACYLIAVQ
jgi:hypothetical protein